jgi:peptidoglycan/LPS O-acetylase OafA/YrhL
MRASTLGDSAVIIFFVLSGFLITSQLESELVRFGSIRLIRFYLRRIFRLVPALFLMTGFATLLAHYGVVPISRHDVLRALTYTSDYYDPKYWTLAHLWSLSVEEQFYLIWPIVLLLAGIARSKKFAIAAILLCPAMRTFCWYAGVNRDLVFRRFDLVADSLAIGCLLALERDAVRNSVIWKRWKPNTVIVVSALVVIVWSLVHRLWPASEIIGRSFISLASALAVGAATFFPLASATKVLSWKPLVWVGEISYSLYLWQQMFLVNTPGVSKTPLPFPLSVLAAFTLAILTYYFFESPIRNFGRRLTARKHNGRVDPKDIREPLEPEQIQA